MTELWSNKKSCYIIIHTLYSRLVNSSSSPTSRTRPFKKSRYIIWRYHTPPADHPPARPAVPHMGNHLAGAALVSFTCHSAPRKNSTCNIMSGLNIEEPCKCPACQAWSHATWPAQSSETSPVHQSRTTRHSQRERERETAHISARRLHKSRGAHFPRTLKPFWRPYFIFTPAAAFQCQRRRPRSRSPFTYSSTASGRAVCLSVCLSARLRLWSIFWEGRRTDFQWTFSMHSKWFPTGRERKWSQVGCPKDSRLGKIIYICRSFSHTRRCTL